MTQIKKKNKLLPLILLVAVLAAMLIGYFALSSANDRSEEDGMTSDLSDDSITVTSFDSEEITEISYTYAGADEIAFSVKDGVWVNKNDPYFPLDTSAVGYMASVLCDIQADREIEAGDESAFGFDSDSTTVSYTASGEKHTLEIGDYNSFSAAFYIKFDGKIYLTADDIESYFSYTESELLLLDEMPADMWTDAEYTVSAEVKYSGAEIKSSDADSAVEIASLIADISLDTAVDYSLTEEERANYGLDKGYSAKVNYRTPVTSTDSEGNESVTYISEEYSLILGSKTDGGYYVSPKDSKIAYLATAESVDALLAYKAEAETEADESEETESVADESASATE